MYINIEECFGFIALIASLIGLLPQVYKAYVTKLTRDVSMLMLVSCLICSLSWLCCLSWCNSWGVLQCC
ncbi:PQ-loop domain-containing transporter [Wolbachia endosymbiont of Oedothorax gibbosus]|uniref:PQ-loop domain-containing transporter n=1 Tax=Wolbachia endosymbiont of Oedothorax gibbosus TaxID=931100 RepID=UPI0020241C79|nr:PQ-loop domain-containing transporter [Wolbachia endosymbiont of Oedothorax gibbosus]